MSVSVLDLVASFDSLKLSLIDFRHLVDTGALYVIAYMAHLWLTTVHYLIAVILRKLFVRFRIAWYHVPLSWHGSRKLLLHWCSSSALFVVCELESCHQLSIYFFVYSLTYQILILLHLVNKVMIVLVLA